MQFVINGSSKRKKRKEMAFPRQEYFVTEKNLAHGPKISARERIIVAKNLCVYSFFCFDVFLKI